VVDALHDVGGRGRFPFQIRPGEDVVVVMMMVMFLVIGVVMMFVIAMVVVRIPVIVVVIPRGSVRVAAVVALGQVELQQQIIDVWKELSTTHRVCLYVCVFACWFAVLVCSGSKGVNAIM